MKHEKPLIFAFFLLLVMQTAHAVILNVTLNTPLVGSSTDVLQNNTFVVTANVTCQSGNCSNVTGALRLNESSIPDTNTSKKIAGLPFYVASSTFEDAPMRFVWNKSYDGNISELRSVKSDIYNNIVGAGYDLYGSQRAWQIMKFNENGTLLWNISYDSTSSIDTAWSLDVDSENNIVVAGDKNQSDWHVVKFNENGTHLWNRTDNPGGFDAAHGVAIDSNNNIIVAGYQQDAGENNWRIMKLNSTGGSIWNLTYDFGNSDQSNSVSVDSNNNIIVAGFETPGAGQQIFRAMKFNENGTNLWNFTYDSSGSQDAAESVGVDINDNVVIAGEEGSAGETDWKVFKLNSSGIHLWNRTYNSSGGNAVDLANSVSIDKNNNVIVGGVETANNIWRIMKFNENGTSLINITQAFLYTINNLWSIETDQNDNIIAAGYIMTDPVWFTNTLHIRKYEINRNPQECPSGLLSGQSCSMTWVVNATGAIGSSYYMDVNFTSSDSAILSNDTGNFQINITGAAGGNPGEISSCQELDTPDTVYTLTQNVNSAGTCFNVTANNVELDCNGFLINYSQSITGYGVIVSSSYNSTTIKNCNIVQGGTSSSSYAVYPQSKNQNSTIINNTITTAGNFSIGIILTSTAYKNSVYNNTITTTGTTAYGVYLFSTAYNNSVYNNTITTTGTTAYGIYADLNVYDNTIYNNIITTTDNSSYAVYLSTNVYNNTFYNNIFNVSSMDILVSETNNWNITLQNGTNIIGGSFIGGNFYANSTGGGFSETCDDTDLNGICDVSYNITANNIDFFPLVKIPPLPYFVSNGFNRVGSTVTMNLAFHIGSNKINDIITVNDNFVSSEEFPVIISLATAKNEFGTSFTSNYSADDYLLQMKQGIDGNRFLLVFTQGSNNEVSKEISSLGPEKIPTGRFGELSFKVPSSFKTFLRLEFDKINIISRAFWKGTQEIMIKNEGRDNGRARIGIEVV
jgi:uncharacterized delta-60 repeat protein